MVLNLFPPWYVLLHLSDLVDSLAVAMWMCNLNLYLYIQPMSPKEKGTFEDMAKQDKVRYEREMKNYIPPNGQKKKRFKDPNAPKRPPSAFFIFCADFRAKIKSEHPGLSIGDTAKKLGVMWNSSAAEEKKPYEKKAATLKEKYDKDIASYRTNGRVDTASSAAADDDDDEDDEEDDDEDDDE
uniref:High mobility group box 1b n=1 Tax=Oncorhynchus mykiss TaxID=8022 RepID=A0A8K9XA78_ONCMY